MLSTICLPAFCIENQLDEQKKQLLQGPANPKHSQEQSNKKLHRTFGTLSIFN